MAKRNPNMQYGRCNNIGNCPKANANEIIEIPLGEDFVCPNGCGPLTEVEEVKKLPWKLIAAIIAAVAVLGGGAAFFLSGSDEGTVTPPPPPPEGVNLTALAFQEAGTAFAVSVGEVKQLQLVCTPTNSDELIGWTSADESVAQVSADGIVKGVKEGTTTIIAQSDRTKTKAEIAVTITAKTETGGGGTGGGGTDGGETGVVTKDFGYAVYKGKMKGGLMNDDNGVLTFKTRHIIEPNDVKMREAEAGERVVGIFENGHLVTGRLYKNDGNVVTIIP